VARRKIIIDTDPGQDDAFALLFALGAPEELEVLGVTTVGGNVPLARTTTNALQLTELAGRADVPVFAGCPRPMLKRLQTAEYVHGESGIDGCVLPQPSRPAAGEHAVNWMIRTIMEAPEGEITVCTLGPMTNLGMAMVMEPKIIPRLREVVLMGGGYFQGGNATPAAEFNIWVDPHAASVVFESGAPVTMASIDCTWTAMMTPEWVQSLRALKSASAEALIGMAEFYMSYGSHKFETADRPIHDACVPGYLLVPEAFSYRQCNVVIETRSPETEGMTVVDWWHSTGRPKNCKVLGKVDAPRFFDRMYRAFATLP